MPAQYVNGTPGCPHSCLAVSSKDLSANTPASSASGPGPFLLPSSWTTDLLESALPFSFLPPRRSRYVERMSGDTKRLQALQMLTLAAAFWGLSFPATKALAVSQQELLRGGSSWFIASLCVAYRFAIAALLMLLLSGRSLARLTRLEVEQGLGLGLFAG